MEATKNYDRWKESWKMFQAITAGPSNKWDLKGGRDVPLLFHTHLFTLSAQLGKSSFNIKKNFNDTEKMLKVYTTPTKKASRLWARAAIVKKDHMKHKTKQCQRLLRSDRMIIFAKFL